MKCSIGSGPAGGLSDPNERLQSDLGVREGPEQRWLTLYFVPRFTRFTVFRGSRVNQVEHSFNIYDSHDLNSWIAHQLSIEHFCQSLCTESKSSSSRSC